MRILGSIAYDKVTNELGFHVGLGGSGVYCALAATRYVEGLI